MEEVNEQIYLTIPVEYKEIYNKILILLSNLGEEILRDCSNLNNCSKTKDVIECWIMFQSAIASRELNDNKKEEVFIKYIKTKIENLSNK